jgi:hypothetical protein
MFLQLDEGWNADPVAPGLQIARDGDDLLLSFDLNAFQFPPFTEGGRASIRFRGCWRHRLGPTNDEGWYRGQCRFSRLAPQWGGFYEVGGDLKLDQAPAGWVVASDEVEGSRHFLFYMKDETFECDAASFELRLPAVAASV